VDADLRFQAKEGESHAIGRLYDAHGTLASIDASWNTILDDLVRRGFSPDVFLDDPLHVSVDVPRRPLLDLPPALPVPHALGTVEAHLALEETLRAPKIDLAAKLADYRNPRQAKSEAVDVDIRGRYGDRVGEGEVAVTAGGVRKLGASLRFRGDAPALIEHRASAWEGEATATATDLPLEVLPWMADERVRGNTNANVELHGSDHAPPHVHAVLEAKELAIGAARGNHVVARLDADERRMEATARVVQTDGEAEVRANVGISWPRASDRVKLAGPSEVTLAARHFRTAALLPVFERYVRDLDGRIDGQARLDSAGTGAPAVMQGAVTLRDGTLRIPTFGDELKHVSTRVSFDEDGVIRAEDIQAESENGKIRGAASARLRGLAFVGGAATMNIPERGAWPIVVEGQAFGETWGKIDVDAKHAPGSGLVEMIATISRAGVRLSETETHALQDLSPAEKVRVGMYKDGFFVALATEQPSEPRGPSAVSATMQIHLRDFEIRRGTELRVRVEGDPVVTTRGELRIKGVIRIKNGYFEAEGKRFEIERGTASFSGDPYNPEIVATAVWAAPEGTRVYADFIGPLTTGKVTLRSEPARTRSEILSLILFGTTTGTGSPYGAGGGAAGAGAAGIAGIGGGIATQGLNRAIDRMTGLDVTARVNTTNAANPRPEVEVRIARDITIALAHVLGVPPPGTNPDRNFVTFDWRFLRNWSLQTTVGDQGSTVLDLVWQYRY
jgi:translocation and assembly module TamB